MLVERGLQPRAPALPRRDLPGPTERRTAGERLEAPDVPAPAQDGGIVGDLDVPDVPGTSLGAAMQPAVGDDAGPDPRPDLDDDDVVVAGGHARSPLPEGQEVDVVVDPHRRAVVLREALADRVAVPAGHDRRRDRPARLELHRARDADADAPQPARDVLGRAQQRVEQRVDALEAALRPVLDPGGFVVVTEDPAIEARDGDVDARGAEVGDQDVAGVGAEGQLARWAAAGARAEVALAHEPAVDELLDASRDDRPAQAGPRDELGARPRAAEPDLVEDRDERVEHLVGQRNVRPRA